MERIQKNFEKMMKMLYSSNSKQFEEIKKVYETIEHRLKLNDLIVEGKKNKCDEYVGHKTCSYYDYLVYRGKKEKLIKEAKEKNLIGCDYLNASSLWTDSFEGTFKNKKELICKVSTEEFTELKIALVYEENQTVKGKNKELNLFINNKNVSTVTLLDNKGQIENKTNLNKGIYTFTVDSKNQIKNLKEKEEEMSK